MREDNRAFQAMFSAAQQMLAEKSPEDITFRSGVSFDGADFLVDSLGSAYRFSYPDYVCCEPLNEWHCLTILHYLNLADGFPVTGEPIPLSDMPDGVIRGTKYDATAATALSAFLRGKSEADVKPVLAALGAQFLPGKADLNAKLPFLPRFPLYLNIWFADDEFPPSARLFVDRSAGHYLTVEDAVMVFEFVIELLKLTGISE